MPWPLSGGRPAQKGQNRPPSEKGLKTCPNREGCAPPLPLFSLFWASGGPPLRPPIEAQASSLTLYTYKVGSAGGPFTRGSKQVTSEGSLFDPF